MSLDSSLSVAAQSLANISQGFSVISQNIANANTTGYATERTTQRSLDAAGQGFGAASGPVELASDAVLQAQLTLQNASASASTTTADALGNLQPVLGSVGAGTDLGSLLGALQSGFSALLTDPGNQAQQGAVVSAAQTLTQQINTLSGAYTQARQSAQDNLVSNVAALNTALAQVGVLSNQIISIQSANGGAGGSVADLQNLRNQALSTISGLVTANFIQQPDGDVLIYSAGGAQLPTRSAGGGPLASGQPLSIASGTAAPQTSYPGNGLPGIVLDGSDITGELTGGSIGANVTLRDQTVPTYQAELDEFSETLATRFAGQGLSLFTDPSGSIPATNGGTPTQAAYVGFSGTISVNPQVVATPSLVRDGNVTIIGSTTGGAAFTPNPNNLAGFTDLINNVVNYALGSDVQPGVAQPAPSVTGLGPNGTLSAPFAAPAALSDFATAITASQSSDSATATDTATEATGTQTALSGQLHSETGVDVDSQLSLLVSLQNAYGANAKIMDAVQNMYTQLLQAVQ
jgi:flagellar hook-associated protein 1 FlgK